MSSPYKFERRVPLLLGLVLATAAAVWLLRNHTPTAEPEANDALAALARQVQRGGPGKDGIPPIDKPEYVSETDADAYVDDADIVVVAETAEPPKIYPRKILVYHEIVNDTIAGKPASITYCPLTGSAIGYYGSLGKDATTFGTTGDLVNSNLLMYDRATDSWWPQVLGTCIRGPHKGSRLDQFPVIWTTWQRAKSRFENALVLSKETGHRRNYAHDPYGSYQRTDSYYQNETFVFRPPSIDGRLPPKKVIVGVTHNTAALAIVKAALRTSRLANLQVGQTAIVATYDDRLDVVRVFSRKHADRTLEFEPKEGHLTDRQTGSHWSVEGECTSGNLAGTQLVRIPAFDVMWFAWAAYHPKSRVFPPS